MMIENEVELAWMKRFGIPGWDASLKRLDKCYLNKRRTMASTPSYFLTTTIFTSKIKPV